VASRKGVKATSGRTPRRKSRGVGDEGKPALSFRYIESSALLAALLEQEPSALAALKADGDRITSALTFAEAARALVRARVAGRLTIEEERAALRGLRTFERRCAVVRVTAAVLTRAGRPFPVEPVRTLDAIHLATAELLGEPPQLVTIITRDDRVRVNAQTLGYVVE